VALLMLFALIAGAGTAITPCVLPVVPALLSASATGGRRRPVGIVLGLALTFTITITVLATVVNKAGLGSTTTRDVAIVVLIVFGIVLLIPGLAARVEAPLSRLARFGPKQRGSGFWSGMAVGGALGFVMTPCAGPILGAVIGVSAHSGTSLRIVVLAICYAIGLSAVMLLYGLGGRAILQRIRHVARGHVVERAMGVILLATGVALAFSLDLRLTNFLANPKNGVPAFFYDPTQALENSNAVQNRLAKLEGTNPFQQRQKAFAAHHATSQKEASVHPVSTSTGVGIQGVKTPSLPVLGVAPDFTNTEQWFNTPGNRPLSLQQLRGKVVLVDFWTYTCINCIRTLPFLKGLYATYHPYGFDVVGVETPEFTFEQDASNVKQAIASDGLRYPVVQDNQYGTWNAYHNQYWPAEYLIDAHGNVRHVQFGEGDYGQSEAAVRELLYQAGVHNLPPPSTGRAIMPSLQLQTPETYLDAARAMGFIQPLKTGHQYYTRPGYLSLNAFALQGLWNISNQSATPIKPGAAIYGHFAAAKVYLVLTSAQNKPRTVTVLLDGHPISSSAAGADVHNGKVTVRGQRLYSLVSFPSDQNHLLEVKLPPGVSAYDFTFG
jgi:cytochrome c biogenesis protein CcdA/thiol-disulfide isomerase/thioredoxin